MLEDQQQAIEPEVVSEQNPVTNERHLIFYVALGLFIVLFIGVGTWFGLKYLKPAPEQVQQDNTSETGIAQFDLTEAETQAAKDEVLRKLRADFGFKEFIGSHVIENEDSPIQDENETLHNMWVDVEPFQGALDVSGAFVAQKRLEEVYESQSQEIDSSKYGTVLAGTSDTRSIPLVSWVSYYKDVPLIFSVSFNSEGVEVADIPRDFNSKSPLLLKSILEKYPPDSELTKRLVSGIDSVRSQNRGYATTKILREETSPSGYKFTLTEFDNYAHISNSCDDFVSGWPVETIKELVSCEVEIVTNASKQTYTDEQLMTLGGLPDKWISGNEIVTSRTEGGRGLGETGYGFVGVFNVDTKQYTQILEAEKPGFYGRRTLIDYTSGNTQKHLLFVEGADAYFLYEVQTDRNLSEYFTGLDGAGSMIDYLNPEYKNELTLVGTMPLAVEVSDNSKYTFDINIDDDKNIVFVLGVYTDFPKTYTYVMNQGVINSGQN